MHKYIRYKVHEYPNKNHIWKSSNTSSIYTIQKLPQYSRKMWLMTAQKLNLTCIILEAAFWNVVIPSKLPDVFLQT